jgi:hypothetical protein
MTEVTEKTPLYAWYALGLLMFVYILNFLDRTIIYILFPLIKKEMEFSDTQLALLGTTSFGWRTAVRAQRSLRSVWSCGVSSRG